MSQYQIEDRAYRKLLLHTLKYHKSDCLGLLLGTKRDKKVTIEDTVPLFHHKVMSGPLELAFDMVETNLVTDTLRIIGVYEAPLLGADTQQVPSPLATTILQQIKALNQFAEPCVISINAVTRRNPDERDAAYMKLEVELHSVGQQAFALTKREIDSPDYRTISRYIEDKSYLGVVDFDDHLENVENDWRNPALD